MAGVTCHKKSRRGYCHHDGQSISPPTTLQTWTHSRHQMSLASYTSILFHSSFDLLHMSLIKPHPHIHTTTQVSQQPSQPKHHITHLILQFFPASSLTHFAHFIPNLFQSQSKFTLLIPQASTRLHFYTSILLIHCLTVRAHDPFQFLFQIMENPNPCKKPLDIGNQEMSDELRNRL